MKLIHKQEDNQLITHKELEYYADLPQRVRELREDVDLLKSSVDKQEEEIKKTSLKIDSVQSDVTSMMKTLRNIQESIELPLKMIAESRTIWHFFKVAGICVLSIMASIGTICAAIVAVLKLMETAK